MKKTYKTLGVMSGTSLDGVDIAECDFFFENNSWNYEFIRGKTYAYRKELLPKLKKAPLLSGLDLALLNVEYGREIGQLVNRFLDETKCKPNFVASHGYTVFHQPQRNLTLQIGSGAEIAAQTGLKTVCDFRTLDVALGGNGAPLVPIGDELLFGNYKACLNLGGFANISYADGKKRIAYDICPVNIILNHLAERLGFSFDRGGEHGRKGFVNNELLEKLNNLPFYSQNHPKSLGCEFTNEFVFPLFSDDILPINLLRTSYEHISEQLAKEINTLSKGSVLVTGGGAYNSFLIELLRQKSKLNLVIPQPYLIEFKEAILFAFLGVLRIANIPNCLKSVTGALTDNIGGAVYSGGN